jgi:type II secretory pathway pseudopilin PulG
MRRSIVSARYAKRLGFSLVEVVIALGVIAVAVVAILTLFPAALQTGHSAQDETRAAHIAQTIFPSLAGQALSQFNNVQLLLSDNNNTARSTPPIDLTLSSGAAPALKLYAQNDGKLTQDQTTAVYAIYVYTNNAVPGFTDPASANEVTVRVLWPFVPNQGPTPAPNQSHRDYVRIISKY